MKIFNKIRFTPLLITLLLVVMVVLPRVSMAAQRTVNLGTSRSFAVLAGSAITNTGTTIINEDIGGDIGLFPGTVFTGRGDVSVSGTVHIAGALASEDKDDLVIAFNDAN